MGRLSVFKFKNPVALFPCVKTMPNANLLVGAEHSNITGPFPPLVGRFLYRLPTVKFGSRAAGSHTRPLAGETYWLVLCRVFKRPAFKRLEQAFLSRLNDLSDDFFRTATMPYFFARCGLGSSFSFPLLFVAFFVFGVGV